MKKATDKISDLVLERIHTHVSELENYDPCDTQFPRAICGTCRIILAKIAKGKIDSSNLPEIINYKSIIHNYIDNSNKCKCLICQVARKCFPYDKICIEMPVSQAGRPKLPNKVICKPIEKDCDVEGADMPQPGPSISADNINEMRTVLGLSGRQTIKCAKMLRSNLGRNSVEPNIDFSLNSRKEIFKGHLFCESHDMDILGTNKIKEKRSVVVCKDLEVLLYEIIKYRDIDQNKHLVKIGIDGGQQFLKICLSLVSLDDIKPKPLQGVFNDDGVKKILILGIAEDIKGGEPRFYFLNDNF